MIRVWKRRALAFVLAGLLVAACGVTSAAEKKANGFIDGSAFRDLAGDDAEVVEVNLGGALLQALAGDSREKGDVGGLLRGLQSIHAYIVSLKGQAGGIERALKLAADMEGKLRGQGWSSMVTVREKKSRINVWTLTEGQTVQGLVVTAVDSAEGSAVFVNIAGAIDLARLGELSSALDVPGLDALGRGAKPKSGEAKEKPPAAEPE